MKVSTGIQSQDLFGKEKVPRRMVSLELLLTESIEIHKPKAWNLRIESIARILGDKIK